MPANDPKTPTRSPRATRILFVVLVGLIPTIFVLRQFSPAFGFARLLICGSQFVERAVPELKALDPPCVNATGYDGQFYAQLATDPFLRGPAIRGALDAPVYRARRILLPLLSWTFAFGQPALALQIYSAINLLFFWALLCGMVRILRPASAFQYACIAAAVLGTGSLVSIARALVDLPAATFVFFGAALGGTMGAASLGAAMLTRETSFLAIGALLSPGCWQSPQDIRRHAPRLAIACVPLALWLAFVFVRFGGDAAAGVGNFGWPFVQLTQTIWNNFAALPETTFRFPWFRITSWEFRLVECLAPLSMLVQAIYLIRYRNPGSAYWRAGIAFVPLFLCLGSAVLYEHLNYLRALLPMTIAFQIELMRATAPSRWAWFAAGNLGLGLEFHGLLVKIILPSS